MHHCTVLMHVIVESMVATFANIVKKITTSYMSNTHLVYEMMVKADYRKTILTVRYSW